MRWGVVSLLVAKFIPGFSTVAPPIAGALRMKQTGFLLAAGAGAALWAGSALAAGWVLRDAVHALIVRLEQHGAILLAIALLLAGLWLAWKLWQRYRFRSAGALPHISPDELLAALRSDERPLVIDLRGAAMIADTGPIPGARVAEHDRLLEVVGDWPRDRLIVTLCACPEDAGAIQAARLLLAHGYDRVRPLRGGYDAFTAAHSEGPAVTAAAR